MTDTYLKDSVFTAVKRDAVCERGTNFNRRYAKGVPVSQRFSWKAVYKRVRGWTSGRSLPSWTFVDTHPPPPAGLSLGGLWCICFLARHLRSNARFFSMTIACGFFLRSSFIHLLFILLQPLLFFFLLYQQLSFYWGGLSRTRSIRFGCVKWYPANRVSFDLPGKVQFQLFHL